MMKNKLYLSVIAVGLLGVLGYTLIGSKNIDPKAVKDSFDHTQNTITKTLNLVAEDFKATAEKKEPLINYSSTELKDKAFTATVKSPLINLGLYYLGIGEFSEVSELAVSDKNKLDGKTTINIQSKEASKNISKEGIRSITINSEDLSDHREYKDIRFSEKESENKINQITVDIKSNVSKESQLNNLSINLNLKDVSSKDHINSMTLKEVESKFSLEKTKINNFFLSDYQITAKDFSFVEVVNEKKESVVHIDSANITQTEKKVSEDLFNYSNRIVFNSINLANHIDFGNASFSFSSTNHNIAHYSLVKKALSSAFSRKEGSHELIQKIMATYTKDSISKVEIENQLPKIEGQPIAKLVIEFQPTTLLIDEVMKDNDLNIFLSKLFDNPYEIKKYFKYIKVSLKLPKTIWIEQALNIQKMFLHQFSMTEDMEKTSRNKIEHQWSFMKIALEAMIPSPIKVESDGLTSEILFQNDTITINGKSIPVDQLIDVISKI